MKQRARSPQDKHSRATALLDAAEALSRELGGVRFVTIGAVTDRVGLHRTGARRYYANREELFLDLAARGWEQWRAAVEARCAGASTLDATGVARIVGETITALPVFCDLLTHVPLTLEGSVEVDSARRYKLRAFAAHDAIAETLAASSVMSVGQAKALLGATIMLAAGFWQVAHPTPTLATLYAQVPQWGHVALDFEGNLQHLLTATAVGLAQTGG